MSRLESRSHRRISVFFFFLNPQFEIRNPQSRRFSLILLHLYFHLPHLFFFYIPQLFGSFQELALKADEFLILFLNQPQGRYQITIENLGSILRIFFAFQELIQKKLQRLILVSNTVDLCGKTGNAQYNNESQHSYCRLPHCNPP